MMEKWIKRLYMGLIFLFLYAPIIVLIVFSFNNSRVSSNWEGFTLKWYKAMLQDRQIMKSLYYTLTIAAVSSVVATVIGTFAAFGIHNMNKKFKKTILAVNNIPILNPDIVTGIALMSLFIFLKMKLGFTTMLLAHITFNIPYVILSVLPRLKQMNANSWEAALDLGATPFYAFRKVILPELLPGIVTGLLIAFTMSIDDFVISFFTTGSGVQNISITVYSMARRGINPKINALSAVMFTVVLMLLAIINIRTNREEKLN